MKKILLASALLFVSLSTIAFAQTTNSDTNTDVTTPAVTTPTVTTPSAPPVVSASVEQACDRQLDTFSRLFFDKQGKERGAFIAANQSIITKQDIHGKWMMAHKNDKDQSQRPPDLTSDEAATFSSFVAQQQAEKIAFFQRQNAAKSACLSGQSISSTVGN